MANLRTTHRHQELNWPCWRQNLTVHHQRCVSWQGPQDRDSRRLLHRVVAADETRPDSSANWRRHRGRPAEAYSGLKCSFRQLEIGQGSAGTHHRARPSPSQILRRCPQSSPLALLRRGHVHTCFATRNRPPRRSSNSAWFLESYMSLTSTRFLWIGGIRISQSFILIGILCGEKSGIRLMSRLVVGREQRLAKLAVMVASVFGTVSRRVRKHYEESMGVRWQLSKDWISCWKDTWSVADGRNRAPVQ